MPKYLGFRKSHKKNFANRVNVGKKRKQKSLVEDVEGSNTEGRVIVEVSESPGLGGDGFIPIEDPGEGDGNESMRDAPAEWSHSDLFFQSYVATNGVPTVYRNSEEIVFVVVGLSSNNAPIPLGMCNARKVDGLTMSYCNVQGCGGSEWAYMDMATRGIGQICRCTQNLLSIFPSIIEVDIPFQRGMVLLCDGIGVDVREDILQDVRSVDANLSREDLEEHEKLKGMAGLVYEFELEEKGNLFKAVCCGSREDAHAWGLTRQYGSQRQDRCLTCKRHTTSCIHTKCIRRCCTDILLDNACVGSRVSGPEVERNEVQEFATVEAAFKRRQLGNFFHKPSKEVAISMHKVTEAIGRIMAKNLMEDNAKVVLDMDKCFGPVSSDGGCRRCKTQHLQAIDNCIIVSQYGFVTVLGAKVCPHCACDPRACAFFFVPRKGSGERMEYHHYIFLLRDLMLCWNSFSETKHTFISLLTTLVKQGMYSGPSGSVNARQLIKASRDSFRQAMRGIIAAIDIDNHHPFQCVCERGKQCKRIHIDGIVLGVRRKAADFEQPWLRCRDPILVKPFAQNYLPKKTRGLLWGLATSGIALGEVLELKLQCPWELSILLMDQCLNETRPGLWHLVRNLRELGMAIGSHYPLNSLIPSDCRELLARICNMELACQPTDPAIASMFPSSRFLGIAMEYLTRHTSKDQLDPFLQYLLLRVKKSTIQESLVEQGECSSHSTYLKSFEGISTLHLMSKTGAMGPKGKWVRSARHYGKESVVEAEKDHARSIHFTPGLVYYLCGGCQRVVGFHVINEKNAESTTEIVEYLYAFFPDAPKEIVYDNGKELELAASLREPYFFRKTRFFQDQMHHRNHTTAPEHYNSKHNRSIIGPLSEQFNASVRCRQNSMMFSSQIGYITLICAQALYWNAKKRETLEDM